MQINPNACALKYRRTAGWDFADCGATPCSSGATIFYLLVSIYNQLTVQWHPQLSPDAAEGDQWTWTTVSTSIFIDAEATIRIAVDVLLNFRVSLTIWIPVRMFHFTLRHQLVVMRWAVLIGIAKPKPWAPWIIAVFIPITHRADSWWSPELPGHGVGLNKAWPIGNTDSTAVGDRSTNDASGDAVI